MAKHLPHAIYDDQELLDLAIAALADNTATGVITSVSGKSIQWSSLTELRGHRSELEHRVRGSSISTNFSRHGRLSGRTAKHH